MRQHPVSRVNQVPTHMVPQVCSPSHDVYHVQVLYVTSYEDSPSVDVAAAKESIQL